jgi:hypothetical protein
MCTTPQKCVKVYILWRKCAQVIMVIEPVDWNQVPIWGLNVMVSKGCFSTPFGLSEKERVGHVRLTRAIYIESLPSRVPTKEENWTFEQQERSRKLGEELKAVLNFLR